MALDKCDEEAKWLRNFAEDILEWTKPMSPIRIHYDSQSSIGRGKSVLYNSKSRNIQRCHNIIRQLLTTGVISIEYVRFKYNFTDPIIKWVNRDKVAKATQEMCSKP